MKLPQLAASLHAVLIRIQIRSGAAAQSAKYSYGQGDYYIFAIRSFSPTFAFAQDSENSLSHFINSISSQTSRVLVDLTNAMFGRPFFAQLMLPQPIGATHNIKAMFQKLAHSTIMRLSESSMDKLYDLMLLGFKRQVMCVSHDAELLDVILNHLNVLKKMVSDTVAEDTLGSALISVLQLFGAMSASEFLLLRLSLLQFLQHRRVKVSIFLQEGLQLHDGTIVIDVSGPLPPQVTHPGTLTYHSTGSSRQSSFSFGYPLYTSIMPCDPNYTTNLGINLYSDQREAPSSKAATAAATAAAAQAKTTISPPKFRRNSSQGGDDHSKAEIDLLSSLLAVPKSSESEAFQLELFKTSGFVSPSSPGSPAAASSGMSNVEIIEFGDFRQVNSELARLASSMDVTPPPAAASNPDFGAPDDLLALMDEAGL